MMRSLTPGPSRRLVRLLGAASLLLAACFDRSGAAIAFPAQAADATTEHTLRYQGIQRSYRLFQPGARSSTPQPLILALHGGWGTGKNMEDLSSLDVPAARAGFLVAYPDGIQRSWNAGTCCNPAMDKGIDDVGFLNAVVADVARITPVDRKRIYGTGLSNGAMMVHRAACEAPSLFAAIAPFAGGIMVANCRPAHPVSALLVQGRADPRIPWDGGLFEGNPRPAMREVVANLGLRDGCAGREKITRQQGIVTCATLKGCANGAEVSWCGLAGVGHQWPGGRTFLPRLLGENTNDFNASEEAVSFFQKH